jgi:ectoine hydroxylase-related dioxygenase (phytanoyl-CoA dioxygenase family)
MSNAIVETPQEKLDPVEQMKWNGYVVLENCLSKDFVQQLHAEFMKYMNEKVSRFGLKPIEPTDGRDVQNNNVKIDFRPEGGNHDLNRWNMHLPTTPFFLNEKIVAHPNVLAIIDALSGRDSVAFILASDTPYPGAGFQNIHQDFPRFGFTVNIPLVDFDDDNAPLEVWPGSHIKKLGNALPEFHTNNVFLSKYDIEKIAQDIPSKRMLLKTGSILIRDHRLVHRGTANKSNEPRPCLSIWYKNIDKFKLSDLTIPIPHRSLCDYLAKYALKMRRAGKGGNKYIGNQRLLNLGNFFGRVIEEFSASDRDYRRIIPRRLWDSFSPRMKHLLRYASIEKSSADMQQGPRSWIGSGILLLAAIGFISTGFYLRLISKASRL